MGLDVKEKAMLNWLGRTLLPPLVVLTAFVTYTGLWREPIRLLGVLLLYYWGAKFLSYLWLTIRVMVRPTDVTKYGKWGIVTGATAGIGESFAHELARIGMDVMIISRSEDKLKKVQADIKAKYPNVQVKYMIFDFADRSKADQFYEKLTTELQRLKQEGGIGLLVNNVGMVNSKPEYTHLLDANTTEGILAVNVEGTVRMTRTVTPFLIEQGKGAILNISSGSGNHPSPMISCYASTKAFITEFSQSLTMELKEFGVDVMVMTPYYVISNQFKRSKETYIAPLPETVIRQTLPLLGYVDRCYPYWVHAFSGLLPWIFYDLLHVDLGPTVMNFMKNNKRRAEEKAAQKNKAA